MIQYTRLDYAMPRPRKARSLIGACSVEETNVSDEQIDYSRPWKPRMDQCEEATLLFGQAHLPLPPTRPTNRVIIYLFIPVTFTYAYTHASGYALFPISGASVLSISYFNGPPVVGSASCPA